MSYGLSPEEVEWVREGYRKFREGDPAFMDFFAPDARITIPATLPGGGTYDSPFDALEFWTTIGELFDSPYPDPEEILRVEDRLIVFGTWRARSPQSGEEIAIRFSYAFRLSGGGGPLMDEKVVSAEAFTDTAATLHALDSAPPAPE